MPREQDLLEEIAAKAAALVPDWDAVDLHIRRNWPRIIEFYQSASGSPPSNTLAHLVDMIRQYVEDGDSIGWCNTCGLLGHVNTTCACGCRVAAMNERRIGEQLRNYSFKIADQFEARAVKGESPPHLFLGVELEVKSLIGQHTNFPTKIERELLPRFAIVKRDGSLGEESFEMNSIPATLKFHKSGVWDKFFDAAKDIITGNVSGHGMHVHVTREVISPLNVSKFLLFMNSDENEELVTTIAGRNDNSWAAPKKDHKITDGVRGDRSCGNGNRHARVNTTNTRTIEIRMFQSTTNKRRFFANVEFIHAAIRFCGATGMRNLSSEDFFLWLKEEQGESDAMYSNLYDFLAAKRLIPCEGKRPLVSAFK